MNPELEVQRRYLVRFYGGYLDADRAWSAAVAEARSWFPGSGRQTMIDLGEPGSPVRRLYDGRERALNRFLMARENLGAARHRAVPAARRGGAYSQIPLLSG